MALDSIDSNPPPFFRQGLSALSKLVLFGLLSVLLMAADHRLGVSQPIRSAVSLVLAPVQWLALLPQRTSAALQARKRGGMRLGRPVVLPQAVRELVGQLRADGLSLRAIAAHLTADGVPTATGGQWHPSTVRCVLASLDVDAEMATMVSA